MESHKYDPPLFQGTGSDTKMYSSQFGPQNMVWSRQNAPVWMDGEPLSFGNYPDPLLRLRLKAADEQLRERARRFRDRDQMAARQVRFNNLISGSGTSFVAVRETNHENFARLLNSQNFVDSSAMHLLMIGGIIFL